MYLMKRLCEMCGMELDDFRCLECGFRVYEEWQAWLDKHDLHVKNREALWSTRVGEHVIGELA